MKRIQLICVIFIKRYTVSFAKAGVFRPVIMFMYMLLLEKSAETDTGRFPLPESLSFCKRWMTLKLRKKLQE